jgi:hypothetical protein
MPGAAGSLGAAGPVIHLLSPWMPLITAPEAVVGRLIGSVSPGASVDRCGRPSRCGRTTSVFARPAAPVGPTGLGGSAVPSTCGKLVPISPQMCTCL